MEIEVKVEEANQVLGEVFYVYVEGVTKDQLEQYQFLQFSPCYFTQFSLLKQT